MLERQARTILDQLGIIQRVQVIRELKILFLAFEQDSARVETKRAA